MSILSTESKNNLITGAIAFTGIGVLTAMLLRKKNMELNQPLDVDVDIDIDVDSIDIDIDIDLDPIDVIQKENNRIESPINLRDNFAKDGYAVLRNVLSDSNQRLNEFVESMRHSDLSILDGCEDLSKCINSNGYMCNFRHRFCRLFMARLRDNEYTHHSFNCKGVKLMDLNIKEPTKFDINDSLCLSISQSVDEAIINERSALINLISKFNLEYSMICTDIVNYLLYIMNKTFTSTKYVADVIFIADPMYNYNNKSSYMEFHKDMFNLDGVVEPYDCVALIILNNQYTTPHKLIIGNNDQIFEEIDLDSDSKDVGYIINQNNIFHKHTEFNYESSESRRNVLAIRFKFIDAN